MTSRLLRYCVLFLCAGFCACATGQSNVKLVTEPERQVMIRPVGIGSALALPEEARGKYAGSIVEPSYELCLDLRPALSDPRQHKLSLLSVRPAPGLPGADAAIEAALRGWSWIVHSSRPLSQLGLQTLCFRHRLRFSVTAQSEIGPGSELKRRRIAGSDPHLPPAIRLSRAGETVNGVYSVCLDPQTRNIRTIKPLVRISGADRDIIEQLYSWAWHVELPPEHSGPICFAESLQFVVEGEKDDESIWVSQFIEHKQYQLAILPALLYPLPAPSAPGGEPKMVPMTLIKKTAVSTPNPHLPDGLKAHYRGDLVIGTYKLCIGLDGSMASVEPILPILGATQTVMRTLWTWRYQPTTIPICFLQSLEFRVD